MKPHLVVDRHDPDIVERTRRSVRFQTEFRNEEQRDALRARSGAGLSQTPCWRRVKKLESDGAICGRALLLDERKIGLGVDVFAHIRLKMHDEATPVALERATLAHPQIVECFSMSGESDYLMRGVAGRIDDYERFLKKVLLHLPGVASVNSSFALQHVKLTTMLPL